VVAHHGCALQGDDPFGRVAAGEDGNMFHT
jgi:hypothetical protein